MQLYISNCTKQPHDFIYWMAERDRPITQNIPVGAQISIAGTRDVLENVVKQHEKYGLVDIKEVDRAEKFTGLAYSFEKPIPVEAILRGANARDEALQLKGDEIRKAAAITSDMHLARAAQELNTRLAGSTTHEIVEESRGPTDSGEKFRQTIEVVPEGQAPVPQRGRGRPPGSRNRPKG